jgi:four helix bundle protein
MDEAGFRQRTKQLGLHVIRLTGRLPRKRAVDVIARQMIRSATSVGANYRAACRARSGPEMAAKLGIVLEEADETHYWLEVLQESVLAEDVDLSGLLSETDELIAMTVASIRTLKSRSVKQ